MATFGSRLKAARKHAGLTQKQLSERTNVPQPNISRIEKEEQDSSVFVVQLAVACGVRAEWLAYGEEPMTFLPADELVRAYTAARERKRELLDMVARMSDAEVDLTFAFLSAVRKDYGT